MQNSLFLKALKGENDSGRPPIWIMRQAGRYIPEYRALRQKYSFLEMCHQPELAAQITQIPIKLFNFDAAILFSDILVVAEAFGVDLTFEEGRGPVIKNPLSTKKDVEQLRQPAVSEKLYYVEDAIKLLKKELKVPLIGFCGAPFTVASYMIEGGSSKDLKKTKQWLLREPQSFHALLDKVCQSSIEYLKLQVKAGVNAIQIFDSWAHVLAHPQFQEFSLHYLNKMVKAIKDVPIILFCRGSSIFAPYLASVQPAGISIDWQAEMAVLRKAIPKSIALQGNLDPDILYADAATIKKEARALVKSMQSDPAFIFNLGHGIHPDTPVDSVKTLISCIKEL